MRISIDKEATTDYMKPKSNYLNSDNNWQQKIK